MRYDWTTSSKVIKAQVNTVQMELQRLLGQNLSGIYLHGSLALGGFQPGRSDIDLIVVNAQGMNVETKREIIATLLRISRMPCPLDMFFLAEPDILPFHHPLLYDLHYSENLREQYEEELRDGSWQHWNDTVQQDFDLTISIRILRECGICLYGKPSAETLPEVPEQAFREAIIKEVQSELERRRQDPLSFVLNACRVLAYLRDGKILAKDEGGQWGLAHLPERYYPLIQQALALYRGERPGRPVGRNGLDDFAEFMRKEIATTDNPS
ncbi:MAG TPA: aminoglycoside adenylyltransferase domain-containing protein [Ktedonobacteraceae bacterium]|jgi:predicted nucleotidyltransferase|nr:aminoglycoside adenylyltransferase domain-containing protein [Ktedonobacteraceae bacterium]